MSVEIRVPTLGESIVDATIASWLKREGDAIHQGDALVELETDKVNVEVNADQDGVLQKVLKREGDVVAVGEVLGIIAQGTEASTSSAQPAAQAASVASSNGNATQPLVNTSTSEAQRPPSPLARRIASEYNVDISQVRSNSPHGRVTKDDVISYMSEQKTPTVGTDLSRPQSPAASVAPTVPRPTQPVAPVATTVTAPISTSIASARGPEERIRMSRRRQTIAQRLVEAQHNAAMLTTFNEVDMSAIMDVRARRKDAFKEKHNVSLGFMSFFAKAVVGALKAFPRLNAEIQGNEMIIKHYYDIGIAVSTDEGLVVPVLHDADRKGFADIERAVADMAKRARSNALSLSELQGGTFTITNGGVFGSLLSTPILNAPQVGILGMHKIQERPMAVNGQVVIRPMMYVALSYDHRIVDGSEAVRFLVKVKELLEDPESLLLEG